MGQCPGDFGVVESIAGEAGGDPLPRCRLVERELVEPGVLVGLEVDEAAVAHDKADI